MYLSFSKDKPRSPHDFITRVSPIRVQCFLLFLQPTLTARTGRQESENQEMWIDLLKSLKACTHTNISIIFKRELHLQPLWTFCTKKPQKAQHITNSKCQVDQTSSLLIHNTVLKTFYLESLYAASSLKFLVATLVNINIGLHWFFFLTNILNS